MSRLPPINPTSASRSKLSSLAFPRGSRKPTSYEPLSPTSFFDFSENLETSRGSFHLYSTNFTPQHKAIVFCIHGASYTGASFSVIAKLMKSEYAFFAPDLRHHGATTTTGPLTINDFCSDLEAILLLLANRLANVCDSIKLFLLGHSLGGAIVSFLSSRKLPSFFIPRGLVCIDVVEDTAIESLQFMRNYLNKRPRMFASISEAILWAKTSGTCKGEESLLVSIPAMLKKQEDHYEFVTSSEVILDNEPFWRTWFEGSFEHFIKFNEGKLLIVADINRLDRRAVIDQMAGKFQVEVLRNVGHSVHEDDPVGVSRLLSVFFARFCKDIPKFVR
ncbi:hypothetical protein RCL1_008387 [Eukaryota sp. TZLM3-RCL]